jgi:hypothetical protein
MTDSHISSGKGRGGRRGRFTRRRFLKTAGLATVASAAIQTGGRAEPETHFGTLQKPYWGDLHTHTALSDGNGSPEDNFQIARSHLDFWAMTDHAYDATVFSLDYRNAAQGRRLLNEAWSEIQDLCRSYEDPGRFVPILGYEWTNFRYGHHNVYYLDYDQPIRMPATLPELYAALRDVDALAIPHHPGYPVGICGKDWVFHDERLSPFVEIYSLHGSSETPAGIQPLLTAGSWMGPGSTGGCVQSGLARGHKLGIIASSDSHGDHPGAYDIGLVGAYATGLDRKSLWEAFHERRLYAVTGDRIDLDFSINGQPMGSTIAAAGRRVINVSAVGWDKIDRVEIVKNNAVFHTFAEPGDRSPSTGDLHVRFFVEWGWDVRDQHAWQGRLTLSAGKILQAVPCFRGRVAERKGTGVEVPSETQCQWTSNTEKAGYGSPARRFADAVALEVRCPRDAELRLDVTCDELKQHLELMAAKLLEASTVHYMENIPSTNDGAYWHQMQTCAKLKVHQARPMSELAVGLTCEDDAPGATGGGTDFYYVRLVQRNQQRAWSSPIWVERG